LAARASLTRHSCLLSANHPLAPAREPEVYPDAVGGPESDPHPALPTTPFTIYWGVLKSTAAINSVGDPQFVAPEVHTSIEHPYPDRVRRKTRAASFKRPYLK
jgi:hypothetical protein